MKMTKIESARLVYEKKGHCFKVTSCFGCFNEKWCESKGCYQSDKYLSEKVALAEAYIKRHESKSKKVDKLEKVTRPNFRKYLRNKIDVTPDAESNVKVGGKAYTADEKYRNFYKALFSKQTFFVRADENIKKDLCYYGVLMKWKSTVKYPVELQDTFLIFDYVNQANRLMYTTNDPDIVKDYPEYDAEKDTLVGFAKERSTEEEYARVVKIIRDDPENQLAEAYIKRHESKTKKKDHILDTTKKVEEPKPIKTVGIDNSDVTLALTAQHEPTPLQIAKMIRDNGYNCNDLTDYTCFQGRCPLSELRCGWSPNLSPNKESERKKLIDDYISANEPVKDCPVNSEIPQPVKLPDFVYSASKNGVGFIDTKNRTFNTNDKGELLINDKPCFATPEEALQVAKKLWSGEGK